MIKTLILTSALAIAAVPAAMAQSTMSSSPSVPSTSSAPTQFVTKAQTANEWRSSKVIGLNIYNSANEKIGSIDDLIIDNNGQVASAVIGVGGFLGLGAKDVAVDFKSLRMARDSSGKAMAKLEATKDQLKAAPDYVFYQDTTAATKPASSAPAR